jgi:hypothetical protein
MDEITWEDPPPAVGRGVKPQWPERLRPLVDLSKRWAKFSFKSKSGASAVARNINNGKYPLVLGKWEATARPTEDGGSDLFVRYLGEDGDADFTPSGGAA